MKISILTIFTVFLFGSFTIIDNERKPIDNEDACSLRLVGLKCVTAEGYATADAIYFKIDGTIWPKKRLRMSAGDYIDLEGYTDYSFSGSINIELWDDDSWDPDDFLGRNTIRCEYEDDGIVRFTEDGANYKLYYKVK